MPKTIVTRAVLCGLTEFTGLSGGIRIALELEGKVHDATDYLPISEPPYTLYEVSFSKTGSWWLPAGQTWPPKGSQGKLWKFVSPSDLLATGTIPTQDAVRPANLIWWVPRGGVEETLTPIYVEGAVLGKFPTLDPP
jgi:hypothetical protein